MSVLSTVLFKRLGSVRKSYADLVLNKHYYQCLYCWLYCLIIFVETVVYFLGLFDELKVQKNIIYLK